MITDLGDRSLYDAVSQCSRCGYCEQACPTYVRTGREGMSARGRNQIVRLLAEDKISDRASAWESLSTCLLCSACTTACPAHVPTAEIVLEGRRMLRGEPHPLVRMMTGWLVERPERFTEVLRWANRFKRWGLAALGAKSGLLRLAGLGALEEASLHVSEAPSVFLDEELKADKSLFVFRGARWAYFAACGINFVFPRVGRATISVLRATKGPGIYLENRCCGLLSYNYGNLDDARTLARDNIRRLEESDCPAESPLVGDCSSCVSHLKNYPQLFVEEPEWRERAEAFARRVKDAAELPGGVEESSSPDTVTYHDSCRALNGQGIGCEPREDMKRCVGFKELPKANVCCGGAGAFAFVHPEMSEELLIEKTGNIASTHAKTVVTTSTSCLIQLARGLKKYYPECEVLHLSEWRAARLPDATIQENNDGP